MMASFAALFLRLALSLLALFFFSARGVGRLAGSEVGGGCGGATSATISAS